MDDYTLILSNKRKKMKTTDKFIKTPELLESEEIILAYPANMTQKDWRAVGGKLFITNQRIIFTTNVIDDKLGGKSFSRAREDVDYIFIKERKLSFSELFSGGLINRLGLKLKDNSEVFFVVNELDETINSIKTELKA